jgi:hypothetical protein
LQLAWFDRPVVLELYEGELPGNLDGMKGENLRPVLLNTPKKISEQKNRLK